MKTGQMTLPAGEQEQVSDQTGAGEESARREILAGLMAPLPGISPKYFYDELGSSLFTSICQLEEYYPTRTEAGIFAGQGEAMASRIRETLGPIKAMIDLGAGDCRKAAGLFGRLTPRRYFAVDVSEAFVAEAVRKLAAAHPTISMQALARDLSSDWTLPSSCPEAGRLFFYPGSSIGNFSPDDAQRFLSRLHAGCSETSALLIGVDLVKGTEILEPAYDDSLGVTAAFNLNILNHVNRLLGSNFNVRDWRHVAFFNRAKSRIEMHLEALKDNEVVWPKGGRRFLSGERILTEYSYKYEPGAFEALLAAAGFETSRMWSDDRGWFGVFLALSKH